MKSVSVDVYLDELDTDDLIEELESRGYTVTESNVQSTTLDVVDEGLLKIYELISLNRPYDHELIKLIYKRTGRVL